MLKQKYVISAACLLLLPALSAQAGSLRYEKTFAQVAVTDNRLILSIEDDGSVALHRPAFMKHSGSYHWQLDQSQLQQLWERIGIEHITAVNQALLHNNLQQQRSNVLLETSDSDVSRIEWSDDQRSTPYVLEVEGLAAWSGLLPDQAELKTLQSTETVIWQWMQEQLAQEVRS